MWLNKFDKRQQQEIKFARLYAQEFNHGTDGHNAKRIIAEMAEMLDAQQGFQDAFDDVLIRIGSDAQITSAAKLAGDAPLDLSDGRTVLVYVKAIVYDEAKHKADPDSGGLLAPI